MKVLYLDGRQAMRVELDGPALRVITAGRADGRYPLARVWRVVVSGQVDWSREALTACLDEGIPITFLAPDGTPRGYCLAHHERELRLSQRFEAYLSRSDWRAGYENWRRAEERRAILRALRRLRVRAEDLRPARVQERLEEALAGTSYRERLRETMDYLQGLVAAQVSAELVEAGLEAGLLVGRRSGLNLVRDFTGVLKWGLYEELRGELGTRAEQRRALTALFEEGRPRWQARIRGLLDRLSYRLGGMP